MSFIANELNKENRAKKRTASGVHKKKGKRGYVGKMIMTSDILSPKERREYQKAGKVVTYNMRDSLMSREDFRMLSKDEQFKTLAHWRDKYTTDEIIEVMGMTKGSYYQLASKLGVSKQYNVGTKPKNEKALPAKQKKTEPVEVLDKEYKENGMQIKYSGKYSAEDIISKLEKLGLLLSDESNQFDVDITVKELAK